MAIATFEQLYQQYASMDRKMRPTYLIAANDVSGAPRVFDGGNITLGVINQAKRVRGHLNYDNVTIMRWSEATRKYTEDTVSQEKAFPSKKAQKSESDLAQIRSAAFALESFITTVSRIRVSRQFNAGSRKALVEAFVEAYREVGGSDDEMSNFLVEAWESVGAGL